MHPGSAENPQVNNPNGQMIFLQVQNFSKHEKTYMTTAFAK